MQFILIKLIIAICIKLCDDKTSLNWKSFYYKPTASVPLLGSTYLFATYRYITFESYIQLLGYILSSFPRRIVKHSCQAPSSKHSHEVAYLPISRTAVPACRFIILEMSGISNDMDTCIEMVSKILTHMVGKCTPSA
jgi:hypothetical protein